DPYGNVRGAAPANWADNHGFLDRPTEAAAGLDLLGARQYDPTTGRFLTVDPLLEIGDPNQMGGYAYAGDNPTTHADPNGDRIPDPDPNPTPPPAHFCDGCESQNFGPPLTEKTVNGQRVIYDQNGIPHKITTGGDNDESRMALKKLNED